MDYFFQETQDKSQDKQEETNNEINKPFNKLNESINSKFTKFESNLSNLWNSINTKSTDEYLNELDKDLEIVENKAGEYISTLSNFIKSSIQLKDDSLDKEQREIDKDELIDTFESDQLVSLGGSRYERELHRLYQDKNLYLGLKDDVVKNVELNMDKIDELLHIDELNKLSNELIPEQLTYQQFWQRYFYLYDELVQSELKKESIKSSNQDEHEQVGWDDDEEDNEQLNLKSVNSSTLEINKSGDKIKKDSTTTNDESDDDWE